MSEVVLNLNQTHAWGLNHHFNVLNKVIIVRVVHFFLCINVEKHRPEFEGRSYYAAHCEFRNYSLRLERSHKVNHFKK